VVVCPPSPRARMVLRSPQLQQTLLNGRVTINKHKRNSKHINNSSQHFSHKQFAYSQRHSPIRHRWILASTAKFKPKRTWFELKTSRIGYCNR
jgi:hypothetical protein